MMIDTTKLHWAISQASKLPRWPSGYRVRLESGRIRVRIPLAPGFFRGRVIPVTSKLALQWLPCQSPGVRGSVLGLVCPVSVCCDWVRWKVWSATSVSVWQHVKLSEQIRPWGTLACCWDVKQPTNKHPTSQQPANKHPKHLKLLTL